MGEELGRRVKLARVAKDLTQEELARAIGVRSSSYVSMLERGERTPSMHILLRLATALEVPPEHLLVDQKPPRELPRVSAPAPVRYAFVQHQDSARSRLTERARDSLLELLPWYVRAPQELRDIVKLLLVGYHRAAPAPLGLIEGAVLELLNYTEQEEVVCEQGGPVEVTDETLDQIDRLVREDDAWKEALRRRLLNH